MRGTPVPGLAELRNENAATLARLREHLQSPNRAIPFVGAGVSTPFGCPGWGAFLRGLADRLAQRPRVDELLAAQDYEGAAELLARTHGMSGFQQDVERAFGSHLGANARLDGVLALLPHLSSGPVVTTNFDLLIERAFEQAGRPIEVRTGLSLDKTLRQIALNKSFLLKIHGSADDRVGRVFTQPEYERLYGPRGTMPARPPPWLPFLLKRLFEASTPLLFLGCSLVKDRTLDVLAHAHRQSGESLVHFAFLARPDDAATLAQRLTFLGTLGIEAIWYPSGRHELIEATLRDLLEPARPHIARVRPESEAQARSEARIEALSAFVVGRDAELGRLDQVLAAAPRRAHLITAEAGAGKSALLAAWAARRREAGDAVAAHFFSRNEAQTDVAQACASLVRQIRRLAGQAPVKDELRPAAAREALYRELSAWTTSAAAASGRPLVVMIDALDESEQMQRPGPSTLPEQVVLVASARAASVEVRPTLAEWLDGAERDELRPLADPAVQRWLAASDSPALQKLAHDPAIVTAITRRAHGHPLYLKHLIDALKHQLARGTPTLALIEQLPAGLEQYAEQQLHALMQDKRYGVRAKKVFALLCALRGPLPDTDLQALTKVSVHDLPWAVTRWIATLRADDGGLAHRFGHEHLADAFARPLGNAVGSARRALLLHCQAWASHRSPYALRHLAEHLAEVPDLKALHALAIDDDFRDAQLAAFPDEPDLTLQAAEQALRLALRTNDLALAAAMLLASARRAAQLAERETPLAALQAGRPERAVRLAELAPSEDRVLWLALLGGELLDAGKDDDARALLRRLAGAALPQMHGERAHLALVLLFELRDLDRTAYEHIATTIIETDRRSIDDPDPRDTTRLLLIEHGRLDDVDGVPGGWRPSVAEKLAAALARDGRLEDARDPLVRIKAKFHTKVLLDLAEAQLERRDTAAALALVQEGLTLLPEDNEPYRRTLMLRAAAITIGAGGPLELPAEREAGDHAVLLAHAARLAAAAGLDMTDLAQRAEATWRSLPSPLALATVGAKVALHLAGCDRERTWRVIEDADAAAAELGDDAIGEKRWSFSEATCALAEAAVTAGRLDAVPQLIGRIPRPYAMLAERALKSIAVRLTQRAGLDEALRWLGSAAPDRHEALLVLAVPALRAAFGERRGGQARGAVARLLGARRLIEPRPSTRASFTLVDVLIDADRSDDAMRIVESMDIDDRDDFTRQWHHRSICIAHAKRGRLDLATALVRDRLADEAMLRGQALEAIAARQARDGDVAAARATLAQMARSDTEAARVEAEIAVALARGGQLDAAYEQFTHIRSRTQAASAIGDLVIAAPAWAELFLARDRATSKAEPVLAWASLGRGMQRTGQAGPALSAFEQASVEAERVARAAAAVDSIVSGTHSRPWRELAAEALRAGLPEIAERARRRMSAAEKTYEEGDDNLLELVKAVLPDGSTSLALELAAEIENFEIATRALDTIGASSPLPPGFLAAVEARWSTRHDRDSRLVWYVRQLARCGATSALAQAIADRPRDLVTAFDLCAEIARLDARQACAIAAVLRAYTPPRP